MASRIDARIALLRNVIRRSPVLGDVEAPHAITATAATEVNTTGSSQLWNA